MPPSFPLLGWRNESLTSTNKGRCSTTGEEAWNMNLGVYMHIAPYIPDRGRETCLLNVYVFPLGEEGESSWIFTL